MFLTNKIVFVTITSDIKINIKNYNIKRERGLSSLIEKQLYRFCGETEKYIKDSVFLSCYRLLAGIGFSFLFAKLLTDILEANWTSKEML